MAFGVHALRVGIVVALLRRPGRVFTRSDAGQTAGSTTHSGADRGAGAAVNGSPDQGANGRSGDGASDG
jgi:hypothetical protein